MGQGKCSGPGMAGERMIVAVPPLIALRRHPGMSHNHPGILRDAEAHKVRRPGAFVDTELSAVVVGDPRGVRPPLLGRRRQGGENLIFPLGRQCMAAVDDPIQTAHLTPPFPPGPAH